MTAYAKPTLVSYGNLSAITGADLADQTQDIYFDKDGNEVPNHGLTGSGPGCADGNQDGICDYQQP